MVTTELPQRTGCSACVGLRAESSFLSAQMIRMSTGHMEGNLQLIYVLLTDCYVYLIRKGIPSRQPWCAAAGREACLIHGSSIN